MTRPRPALLLEWALVVTWILHGVAMLAMAGLLLPTMPGGPTLLDGDRIARIAAHPWLFRLGWLPWHLTAASDLFLAYALVRTEWIPRVPAWLVVALTLVAVVPDQGAQFVWITKGVELAQQAVASGDAAPYLALEKQVFPLTGVWAALLYMLGALGWTACFALAGAWSRTLTILSVLAWGTFGVVTVGPLLFAMPLPMIAVGNALGFLGLMAWIALVAEETLWFTRPPPAHGRWAEWRAPRAGLVGHAMTTAANSQFVRKLCSLLPVLDFKSDITDVVT